MQRDFFHALGRKREFGRNRVKRLRQLGNPYVLAVTRGLEWERTVRRAIP